MTNNKIFLYEQIIEKIINFACENNIKIGERLPSERKLAELFDCSYLTLRKAIALMIKRQLVVRKQGSGTYLLIPLDGLTLKRSNKISLQSARILAVLVQPDVGHFTGDLLDHLVKMARVYNTELVIHPIADFDDSSLKIASKLVEHGYKGIIIPRLSPYSDNEKLDKFLSLCDIPTVTTFKCKGWEHLLFEELQLVGLTARHEIQFACEYFIQLGYEKICYISPEIDKRNSAYCKIDEYETIMSQHGRESLLCTLNKDFSKVDSVIEKFAKYRGKTALICFDDDYALRLMTSLYKRSFLIPEDFALIGCNNVEIGAYSEPPLSTFEFPYDYLAEKLISETLMRGGEDVTVPSKLPEPLPVIRKSCGGWNEHKEELDNIVNKIKLSQINT